MGFVFGFGTARLAERIGCMQGLCRIRGGCKSHAETPALPPTSPVSMLLFNMGMGRENLTKLVIAQRVIKPPPALA